MTVLPLWWDEASGTPPLGPDRHALTTDTEVDVCVVGAGYTGLWTAYYLLEADPSLQVLVLEQERAGFGASGRNGGWVSALYPVSPARLARDHGEAAARDQHAALRESVTEVGRVAADEGIDCGFRQGGTVVVARGRAQGARAREEVAEAQHWGLGTTWLEPDAARERLAVTGLLGATYNPHCARVHPYRLARGLASAVEDRGGTIREHTPVARISPGRVETVQGPVVRARHVIRATEAWTSRLPRHRRTIAPVYSLIVATEPLPETTWAEIGLAERETFSEHRHVIVYGQRSVDDRLVFGGRGAPYHFGSGIRPEFDGDARVFETLRTSLREMLPALGGARFTHAWGGPLGIARDWHPSVGHDPATGLAWAGGYVGDGVATTNLAGRTLADLVTGRHTSLTSLPWVDHRSRAWEPEPLRWLGINAGLRLAGLADHEERLTGRPARLGRALSLLTGH
jgi:glycine/D-amino acid oxidase-like deaminating enzyme